MIPAIGTLQPADTSPSVRLARMVAAFLPMLLLAHPLLVSPLLFGEALRATADLKASVTSDVTQTGSFLLTAIYFPAIFLPTALTYLIVWPRIPQRVRPLLWLFAALIVWAIVSSAWSLSPRVTLLKSIQNMIFLLTTILPVLVVRDPGRLLTPIFWLLAVVLAFNLVQVVIREPGPIGHEGIYEHKNILGGVAVFTVAFGVWGLFSRRVLPTAAGLFMVLGGLVALLASESKTAAGLMALSPVAGIGLYLIARWTRIAPPVALGAGVLVAIAAFLFGRVVLDIGYTDILQAVFNDTTFTGRTFIWEFTWSHIQDRWLLGHGFQGFWNIGSSSPRFSANMSFIANLLHSHNGYLQVWLEMGLVGLGMLSALITLSLWHTARLIRFRASYAIFALTAMVYIITNNLMETDWFTGASIGTTLFIIIGLTAAMPLKAVQRPVADPSSVMPPEARAGQTAPLPDAPAGYAYQPRGAL